MSKTGSNRSVFPNFERCLEGLSIGSPSTWRRRLRVCLSVRVCVTEIISIAVRGTTISLDVNNHAQKQLKQKAKRTAAARRASEVAAKRETLVFMWIPLGLERLLCSVHQFCYHTCSLQLRCHVAVTACIFSCSFPCRCVGRTCRISGKPPQR